MEAEKSVGRIVTDISNKTAEKGNGNWVSGTLMQILTNQCRVITQADEEVKNFLVTTNSRV